MSRRVCLNPRFRDREPPDTRQTCRRHLRVRGGFFVCRVPLHCRACHEIPAQGLKRQQMHDHAHAHSGHSHRPRKEGTIAIAAALTGGFMLAEVAGGVISGSLALLADAGHMLTDFASLMLAWFAFRIARRPADWKRTYGYDRFSVLAAFVNGMALFVIAAWILVEAVKRLAAR
jgi:hypothetical protein